MEKPVNFFCHAPDARQVAVIGDFNGWDTSKHPMRQGPDGAWHVQVPLSHGHHAYCFWVDGERRLDPRAQGIQRDAEGNRVGLLSVS
jgi:1,4-alpha-glucan branching enzyme